MLTHNVMKLENVLDILCVQRGDVVFLHTSYSRVRSLVESPADLINRLIDYLGPAGTLVMPRYSWHLDPSARPWKGYADYYSQLPLMDLRTTPVNIGAVPEIFRQMQGVRVSVSHFWPLTGYGPDSMELLAGQEKIHHAFGPDSCFSRLLDANAKVLGLGVTLNTSSIAPVSDYRLGEEMPHDIFSPNPMGGRIVDMEGEEHQLSVITLLPEAVRVFRPARILENMLEEEGGFPFVTLAGNHFFCYPASLYHEAAMVAGRLAIAQGRCAPWLDEFMKVQ